MTKEEIEDSLGQIKNEMTAMVCVGWYGQGKKVVFNVKKGNIAMLNLIMLQLDKEIKELLKSKRLNIDILSKE